MLCCKAGSPPQRENTPQKHQLMDGLVLPRVRLSAGTADSTLYPVQVFYWNVRNREKVPWRFSLCMLDEPSERFQRGRG